jgi:hypothetical protein
VWSGKKWRVVRTQLAPDNLVSELNQLSCGARTIRCVTVGARYRIGHSSDELTLGQWWDGRSWRLMPTPNP